MFSYVSPRLWCLECVHHSRAAPAESLAGRMQLDRNIPACTSTVSHSSRHKKSSHFMRQPNMTKSGPVASLSASARQQKHKEEKGVSLSNACSHTPFPPKGLLLGFLKWWWVADLGWANWLWVFNLIMHYFLFTASKCTVQNNNMGALYVI